LKGHVISALTEEPVSGIEVSLEIEAKYFYGKEL